MPQRILGLDVGTYSVKVAEITRSFKSFELVHFWERPVQYNDVLTKEESTMAAIQAVLEDNNLAWDEIICAMPGERVATRLITLPFGKMSKIDQTVEFEMEDYIPFDIEDVIIDYTANVVDKNLSKVMVAYCNKGEFVKYLTMLTSVDVDPKIISMEGSELINLMHYGLVPPETPYAIIDIGHSKTTVTIGRGKKLIFTRVIPIAGRHINQAIHEHLKLPLDESARLKVEAGHISAEGETDVDDLTKGLHFAITSVIDDLLIHIRQTFFAHGGEEGESIEGIYLCGGSSRLPGLDEYISYKLRQNVTFIDCTDFHFSRLDKSEVHPNVVAQALSLALRGVSMGGGAAINFRSGEFAYRGSVTKIGGGVRQVAVALSLILFLGIVYFGVQYCALKKKSARVTEDIATIVSQALDAKKEEITGSKKGLELIKNSKKEIVDKIGEFENVSGVRAIDILKEVSARLPPRDKLKVDINKLSIAKERIMMAGSTTSETDVDTVIKSYEGSSMFENVVRGSTKRGTKGETKFDLTMELKKPGEEGGKAAKDTKGKVKKIKKDKQK